MRAVLFLENERTILEYFTASIYHPAPIKQQHLPKPKGKHKEHKMSAPHDSGVPTHDFHPDNTSSQSSGPSQNTSPPPLFPQPYSLSGRLLPDDNAKPESSNSGDAATTAIPLSQNNMDDPNHEALYEKGYEMRKKVVGEDYVAAALEKGSTDFLRPLQQFATVCLTSSSLKRDPCFPKLLCINFEKSLEISPRY